MADDATVVAMPVSQQDTIDQPPEMVKPQTPVASPRAEQPETKPSRDQTPRSDKGTPRDSKSATPRGRRCDCDMMIDDEDESLMPGRHEPSFRYVVDSVVDQLWSIRWRGVPPSPLRKRHSWLQRKGYGHVVLPPLLGLRRNIKTFVRSSSRRARALSVAAFDHLQKKRRMWFS